MSNAKEQSIRRNPKIMTLRFFAKTVNRKKKLYLSTPGSALIKNLQQNGISHFAFSSLI